MKKLKLPVLTCGYTGGINFGDKKQYKISFLTLKIFIILIIIGFVILISRLVHLTLVKGRYYKDLAERNRTRQIIIEAKRGAIVDRQDRYLAQSYDVNLSDQSERIRSVRRYFYNHAVANLLGYRQLASQADIDTDKCLYKIVSGDKIGRRGIEQVYDCELRGINGYKLIETNVTGERLRELSIQPPIMGHAIKLTIDAKLQEFAYQQLAGRRGAVVVADPRTNELLALVSSPSYDPQVFEDGNSKQIDLILKSQDNPMLNRPLEGIYAPGSTFKMVVATAALEEKVVEPDEEVEDNGFIKLGKAIYNNWYYTQKGMTDDHVNVVKALQRSNDIYFYVVGGRLGGDKIKRWATWMGFGKTTQTTLAESVGLVPFPFWKQERIGESWYEGDNYNLSIGQGYMLATPIQVARLTNIFARANRQVCQFSLIYGEKVDCKSVEMSQTTIELVKRGMEKACQPGGTSGAFTDFKINGKLKHVACKTGTAEFHAGSKTPHAWFTMYGPTDNPQIVITVLLEEAGQGSEVAAPIARKIADFYFNNIVF